MVSDFLYFWILGNTLLNKGKQINSVIVLKDSLWLNTLETTDVLRFPVDPGRDTNPQLLDDVPCQIAVIYVAPGDEPRVVLRYTVRGRCGPIHWTSG